MKRSDIPANCFAAGFLIAAALLAIVASPFVVLAYALSKKD